MSSLQAKADSLALGSVGNANAVGGQFAGQTVPAGPVEVIVGFSAANFISQANGVAKSTFPATTTFGIGGISDNGATTPVNLGSPVVGTAPNLTPNATFFTDGTFGRNVYFVLDNAKATAPGNTFLALKNMFLSNTTANTVNGVLAGHTAEVCTVAAQLTVNKFGFLSTPTCGTIASTGTVVANPS